MDAKGKELYDSKQIGDDSNVHALKVLLCREVKKLSKSKMTTRMISV